MTEVKLFVDRVKNEIKIDGSTLFSVLIIIIDFGRSALFSFGQGLWSNS